jgi:glucokinase
MTTPLYASIDLGGTKIAAALATADGQIVCERTVPTHSHEGPQAILGRMAVLINELAAQLGSRPVALGMGMPGWVDLANGVSKYMPNLLGQWRDVPVREILAPQIGCPVYLLNDVRMATLAELTYGHGKDTPGLTMVFFAIGTGIGGGVAVDGKLRLGAFGSAGELGHLTVVPDGPWCVCGNRGCLETLASGPAITAAGVRVLLLGNSLHLHELTGGDLAKVNPLVMAQAAALGDVAVAEVIADAAEYIGIAVTNVIGTLHPEMVVLGGGVAEIGDLLFDTVRATVKRRFHMFPPDDVRIVPSKLGVRAGIWGGIALAVRGGLSGA